MSLESRLAGSGGFGISGGEKGGGGNPNDLYGHEFQLDANGFQLDANGNPMLDISGNPIRVGPSGVRLNADGTPMLGASGNPLFVDGGYGPAGGPCDDPDGGWLCLGVSSD